jgi:hypothetical protein
VGSKPIGRKLVDISFQAGLLDDGRKKMTCLSARRESDSCIRGKGGYVQMDMC